MGLSICGHARPTMTIRSVRPYRGKENLGSLCLVSSVCAVLVSSGSSVRSGGRGGGQDGGYEPDFWLYQRENPLYQPLLSDSKQRPQ